MVLEHDNPDVAAGPGVLLQMQPDEWPLFCQALIAAAKNPWELRLPGRPEGHAPRSPDGTSWTTEWEARGPGGILVTLGTGQKR